MSAPIALFVYKRPELTLATLEALSKNDMAQDSVLYVFSDGIKPNATLEEIKKIEETRQIIRQKKWCKEVQIFESQKNKGLAQSIIDGVTQILHQFDTIIVLEDDLITSRGFLRFMNEGLEKYRNHVEVMQISGYQFPIESNYNHQSFFLPMTSSWGWATWRRAWNKFDPLASGFEELQHNKKLRYRFNLNGAYDYTNLLFAQMVHKTVDSWAIRWWWTVFKNNGMTLYPDNSLVQNVGFGVDATHTNKDINLNSTSTLKNDYYIELFPNCLKLNNFFYNQVTYYLYGINKEISIIQKIKILLKRKYIYIV